MIKISVSKKISRKLNNWLLQEKGIKRGSLEHKVLLHVLGVGNISRWDSKITGRPVLNHTLMHIALDNRKQRRATHNLSKLFESMPGFEVTGYVLGRYSRELISSGLSEELVEFSKREFDKDNDVMVDPFTDEEIDYDSAMKHNESVDEMLEESTPELPDNVTVYMAPCVRRLVTSIYETPVESFTSVLKKNLSLTRARVRQIQDCVIMEQQTMILNNIEANPVPAYHCAENSQRIFTVNHIQNLRNDIKNTLIGDCWKTYDLKSAYLNIVTKLWDMKEIRKRHEDIYREIARSFPHGRFKSIKHEEERDFCKEVVNRSIMGSSSESIVREAALKECDYHHQPIHRDIIDSVRELLLPVLNHPIVVEIRENCARQFQQIKIDGGMLDINKNFIELTQDRNCASVFSHVLSSYEMELLFPILEEQTKMFNITLWEHDGFSIEYIASEEECDLWLKKAVRDRGTELGINAVLHKKK